MQRADLKLDNCVKCSDCNAACPVLKVYPSFPGPKGLGPDMERFRREGVASDSDWVEYCMGCHRCDMACPEAVNVSELIARGKAQHTKSGRTALRDHWLARPSVVGKLSSSTSALSNAVMNLSPSHWAMSLVGITPHRRLPRYASDSLRAGEGVTTGARKALFFPGCFLRYNQPNVGRQVIELLRLNGFAVEVTPDICCGTPAGANGDAAELMNCVQKNVAAMEKPLDAGACIVTACTSCGYALKAEYSHLPTNGTLAAGARKIAANTYDLGEFLTELLDAGRLRTDFRPIHIKLAYHAPCHLKSQGIGRPWLRLLRAVPGVEIEEIKADCCGMAGTYGFKQEKYPISMDVGYELFERIKAYEPDAVVTECGSCQMQIVHGTGLEVLHPAEVLYAAYHTTRYRKTALS
jgi:glycerol-3-phosphate dehydrogenase subunit C